CDIVIAADTARFGQPEITLGTIPGAGGTQRLTRFVGKAKAMDLCLTGRMMDAPEAERAGLVSRIGPAAELLSEALKIAERIARTGRHIVERTISAAIVPPGSWRRLAIPCRRKSATQTSTTRLGTPKAAATSALVQPSTMTRWTIWPR